MRIIGNLFILLLLFSCESDVPCDQVKGSNCTVSRESFRKIAPGMKPNELQSFLGRPYFSRPDNNRGPVQSPGRMLWRRYREVDRKDNVFLIVEVIDGSVKSKELEVVEDGVSQHTREKLIGDHQPLD